MHLLSSTETCYLHYFFDKIVTKEQLYKLYGSPYNKHMYKKLA